MVPPTEMVLLVLREMTKEAEEAKPVEEDLTKTERGLKISQKTTITIIIIITGSKDSYKAGY